MKACFFSLRQLGAVLILLAVAQTSPATPPVTEGSEGIDLDALAGSTFEPIVSDPLMPDAQPMLSAPTTHPEPVAQDEYDGFSVHVFASAATGLSPEPGKLPESEPEPLFELDLEFSDEPLREVIETVDELNGVPLIRFTDDERSRVYFGVNFDGTIGIHGSL